MFQLSGRLGRVYVGHRRSMELSNWAVSRTVEFIGGSKGVDIRGTATVVSYDSTLALDKPTKIALRSGGAWWIWTTGLELASDGQTVAFTVTDDPEVIQQGRSYYAT